MGQTYRIAYDGNGNEIDPDSWGSNPDQPNDDAPAATAINANQKYNFKMQQGAEAAEAEQRENAQRNIDGILDEVNRLESVLALGEFVPEATIKALHGNFRSAVGQWGYDGGSEHDPQLIELRHAVERITEKYNRLKRR